MTNALKNTLLFIIINCALFVALSMALTPRVDAQDQPMQTPTPVTTAEEAQPTEQATETYNFVAQPGDSYSLMARKATQIYGIESQTNLSEAQIIFVETNLTQAAGSIMLDLEQAVTIEKSTVGDWAEKAKGLSESEIAAWQVYADMADFNTNAVGEAN